MPPGSGLIDIVCQGESHRLDQAGSERAGNHNFSISSSNEYSGLISFRIDWLDLLAVQGTLTYIKRVGFPGGTIGTEPTCHCRRHGFDPWVGKIPSWMEKTLESPLDCKEIKSINPKGNQS